MKPTRELSNIKILNNNLSISIPGHFAQTYNDTSYNNFTYGSDNYGQAPFNGEITQASSGLVNTGSIIGLGMLVGAVIIFTAVSINIKRKRNHSDNTSSN